MSLFTRARKFLSVAVIMAMLFSVLPAVSAAGAVKDDVSGHWAQENLKKWVKSGLLEGYEDGSIQPDRPVTRAELMTLINRAFLLSEKETITFADLPSSNWAFEQVAIAVKAGYVKGYEDGTIRWNQQVTREEAAKMVADLIQINVSDSASTSSFKDAAI
ncbi:S-layer homology domain-containing protein, partial [Paenibacillus sp. TAF43_2]|uniref:S-layer homology domain-containing protein n=1 Tax=Paenibacillus sp. TAF43_2 TaxID=3233069 RepID=UPI003F9DBF60